MMQYGRAAGVCRPRDDIRDISRVSLWRISDGLFGAEAPGGGRRGGETRDTNNLRVAALQVLAKVSELHSISIGTYERLNYFTLFLRISLF